MLIKLTELVLPKEQLDKMDKKSKKRYVMFTCMIRDLNLLQKCLIFAGKEKPSSEPLQSANTTIGFFFLKTLLSKIYEMWIFLNRNKVFESLDDDTLKQKAEEIKAYFSDEKVLGIFEFIRNKFGFHYEYWDDVDEKIDDVTKLLPDLKMWLSNEDSGNEIFPSTQAIILKVIFNEMERIGFEGDDQKMMNYLFDFGTQGARILQEFSAHYLSTAFQLKWEVKEELDVEVPLISDVYLPLLVAKGTT